MAVADTVSMAVHVLVGGVWVGAVTFVVGAVLPVARDGQMNATPLAALARRLRSITRASAVLILLTGLHLTAVGYDAGTLVETEPGNYVLTMAILWVVATGLTEAGVGRLLDGTSDDKVREPARKATRLLQGAAFTGGLVLLTAGALVGRFHFGT